MQIHPAAALFPMMSEDELRELAADIAENGLIHPIILDKDGQLIDGRNRLAACELAKVEPRFEQLNGRDPLAFIVSANLARRNLTKGQQAMALAMIYPNAGEHGRGKKSEAVKSAETSGFSSRRLQQARSVLRQSPALAEDVVKGTLSLDQAIEKARELTQSAKAANDTFERIRQAAPDLADRVTEETLTVDEAFTLLLERESENREIITRGEDAALRISGLGADVSLIHSALHAGANIHLDIENLKNAFNMLIEDMEGKNQ